MRLNYYLALFILFSQIASSQDIIVHYGYNTYHSILISNDFTQFKDNFCNKTYGFGTVCYQQNGLLYSTSSYYSKKGNSIVFNVDLKYVDLLKCDTTIITHTSENTISPLNLFVDYSGRIYCCDRMNPFDSIKLYCCDKGFNNIQVLRSVSDFPEPLIHDMVILGTDVIVLNNNYNQLYIMDTNYIIQRIINPRFHITKLTSKYINCKDRRLIVSGYPYTHAVYDSLKKNPNHKLNDTLYLFDYDYKVDTFKFLGKHYYAHMGRATIPSLTSFDDILSSDPECEFLLDLDRDNSSGLYPYDFKHRQIICGRDALPLSDMDLYIESDLGVDSMQIRISGMKDLGAERIIVSDSSFKNYLRQRNDSLYSFILPGIVNVNQLKAYLQSLRYVHEGIINRTEGDRAVVIKIFAEGNVSRQAICNLSISQLQLIGRDTAICYYDSLMDEQGRIYYPGDTMVNMEGKNINGCDSVELLIIKPLAKEDIQITGDTIICNNAKNELCISGGSNFIWYSGINSRCIEISNDGVFQARVFDQNNCKYEVQFKVSKPEPIHYELELIHPKCFGDRNGNLSVKQQNGIHEYVLGTEINTSGTFSGLAAGEYILGCYDKYRCLYLDTFELLEPPEISIRYEDTIIVKDRIPELLSILDQNQNIANMKLLPEEGSRMLEKWQYEINPEKGGHYMIVATDSNGCSKEYVLVVILDLDYNVFYPNVFSPNEDGVNDYWNVTFGSGYRGVSLEIFDRWGNRTYAMLKDEIGSGDTGWNGINNGQKCLPGVYVFKLILTDDQNQVKHVVGTISLLR
ncbi:MAG: gliding motility-associated C-terminal domain-containing protein [Saprospiraceae bacterium]|nr:gliding motility-associated C-terminal domain-containing protein [Saprospiraceae bacterium]